MESSPLTQQNTPDTQHEPKITQLYLYLFNVLANEIGDNDLPDEGFWRELFLLNPDKQRLFQILDPLTADDILHMRNQTRAFFRRAVLEAGSEVTPNNEHALENLTGFLNAVLSKRYTNPSTDVIEVLAGLDSIDRVVSDLVNSLDGLMRQSSSSIRTKAVEAALALVSGAYQTTLVSYFIHRDLFPALMKVVSQKHVVSFPSRQRSEEGEDSDTESFILLGLLANYNKFEVQNPYQNRLADFVNGEVLHRLATNTGATCRGIREAYVAVQDDTPEGWNISSTLVMVGLRALSPAPKSRKAQLTEDEMRERFINLPTRDATISLSIYSFIHANRVFASTLVVLPPDPKSIEPPFAAFISSTSYVAHHAYRSPRATAYTVLNLLTLRLLCEDQSILKRLSSTDKYPVRLARQRAPFLPLVTAPRVPTTAILDICIDTISHNLRRRLDVPIYSLTLGIILRLTTQLESTHTRLAHHWSYIWASLLSLLRFLVQYATDLSSLRDIRTQVCTPLTAILAHCLSRGDTFLPDPSSYDDLFYKLVEAAEVVKKFKEIYVSSPSASAGGGGNAGISTGTRIDLERQLGLSMNALLSVSSHYADLLGTRKHQSPVEVQKVIKEGYETLNLGDAGQEFGAWDRFREVEWRSEIKRILRVVVEDAKIVGMR